jgi:tetratricopeptide (TPR) repeat protein
MLETIREFAEELLDASGEREAIRRRHAEHYLEIAESANLSLESLVHGPQRHDLVLPEEHNLRAAIGWAVSNDVELALRLLVALENFWVTHDPSEGARWFETALGRADDVDIRLKASAFRDYGGTVDMAGDTDKAATLYETSRRLFEQVGDESGAATGIFRLGVVAHLKDDLEEAHRLYEESLAIFRRIGDRVGELQALGGLGDLEFDRGNRARGRELISESARMGKDIGWVWWEIGHQAVLASEDLKEGRIDEGESEAREVLRRADEISDRRSTVNSLGMLAWAAAERGDINRAARLWAAVQAELARAPVPRWDVWRPILEPHMPEKKPQEPPLTLEEAVKYALSADD